MTATGRLPAYVPPFPVEAPHRVRAAPRRLQGPTVVVDDGWPAAVALRLRRLGDDAAGVRVAAGGGAYDEAGLITALRAAVDVVRQDAPRGRGLLPDAARAHLAGLDDPVAWLADTATLEQPADLVVVRAVEPGRVVAELLAVAMPSGWAPRHRAGADLAALHGPVAEGGRLRGASAALAAALLSRPLLNQVWGVQRDHRLDHDPSAPEGLPPADPSGGWWLRVERQTTTPLPHLGRALFWIRPGVVPVAGLSPERRRVLAAAVLSMGATSLAYKGLDGEVRASLLTALAV